MWHDFGGQGRGKRSVCCVCVLCSNCMHMCNTRCYSPSQSHDHHPHSPPNTGGGHGGFLTGAFVRPSFKTMDVTGVELPSYQPPRPLSTSIRQWPVDTHKRMGFNAWKATHTERWKPHVMSTIAAMLHRVTHVIDHYYFFLTQQLHSGNKDGLVLTLLGGGGARFGLQGIGVVGQFGWAGGDWAI